MRFNKGKALHWEQVDSMHQYRLGKDWLGCRAAEKDLGPRADQVHNRVLGCVCSSVTCKSRAVIILLYLALKRPPLASCVQFLAPHFQGGELGKSPVQGSKNDPGLGDESDEERLKALQLFSLEKGNLGRDLKTIFKSLKGDDREDECGLFSVAAGDKTRSNGVKLQ